jgi:hypothetical protein
MKKIACLLAVVLALAIGNNSTRAGDYGGVGLGLGYLYGQGHGFGYNYGSVIRPYWPPYFSIHPPVYYGKRYTRPYGASFFAAWPQLQPSSSYAPQPHPNRAQIIANPHVPCLGDCTCGHCVVGGEQPSYPNLVRQKPAEPLIIDNPYYQPNVQYTFKHEDKID